MCETDYIFSTAENNDRATRIKQIISGLEAQYILSLSSSSEESYMLDDGQTKIQTTFRDPNSIIKAIEGFDRLLNRILNTECGGIISLRDARAWLG